MRSLTDREKRTVRLAVILVFGYLAIFYGVKGIKILEAKRQEYTDQFSQAEDLNLQILQEITKRKRLDKLKDTLCIDLEALKEETVVGEACAAIQKQAQTHGIQLGPTKETPLRSSSRELATIQIEGKGSVTAAAQFLRSLRTIGYPLFLDSIHIKADSKKPGHLGFSLNLVVLNFAAWNSPEESSV